jgi:hypothetical protein
MASGTRVKKHKCSCGRSFRHAISLKRHQNVTGCDASSEETSTEATPKTAATPAKPSAPAAPVEDDRTIVITAELVAAWQEQTGFQSRRGSVIDSLPARQPEKPKVDWVAVAQTSKAFLSFCGEVQSGAFRAIQNLVVVLGRGAIFVSVIALTGWLMITGVQASDSNSIDETGRRQLAAQTLVQDFLQTARLNQYGRAHNLLAPGAKSSVTPDQLKMMFNSLPLNETPGGWSTQISDDEKTARVIVSRGGVHEVYTVVLSNDGWGLASVSIED